MLVQINTAQQASEELPVKARPAPSQTTAPLWATISPLSVNFGARGIFLLALPPKASLISERFIVLGLGSMNFKGQAENLTCSLVPQSQI